MQQWINVSILYAVSMRLAPFVDGLKLQKAYQLLSDFEFDSAYPVVAFFLSNPKRFVLAKNKHFLDYPEYLNKRQQ